MDDDEYAGVEDWREYLADFTDEQRTAFALGYQCAAEQIVTGSEMVELAIMPRKSGQDVH